MPNAASGAVPTLVEWRYLSWLVADGHQVALRQYIVALKARADLDQGDALTVDR